MKILLVTYEASPMVSDSLRDLLKGAKGWWNYLPNVWLLFTEKDLKSWKTAIRNVIGDQDNFFIVDVTDQDRNGWLPRGAWDWLHEKEEIIRAQGNPRGGAEHGDGR